MVRVGIPDGLLSGAANLASTRPTGDTTSVLVLAARPTRRSALVLNVGGVRAYLGPTPALVASGNKLDPGESRVYTFVGQLDAISSAGTWLLDVVDEYD